MTVSANMFRALVALAGAGSVPTGGSREGIPFSGILVSLGQSSTLPCLLLKLQEPLPQVGGLQ